MPGASRRGHGLGAAAARPSWSGPGRKHLLVAAPARPRPRAHSQASAPSPPGPPPVQVRVPRIVWEGTARRVLTMEWIEGVKLTDGPRMAAAGLDVVDFVGVGVECTLRQLLEAGFFHAGESLVSIPPLAAAL